MNDVITNTRIKVRSVETGRVYDAQYVVERPLGQFGMVSAWMLIMTEHGVFLEAYKPTVTEAIGRLRERLAGKWERA